MGGMIGNSNADKGKNYKDRPTYLRRWRKERAGNVEQARKFVGRPKIVRDKGDIFDVAAKLYNALQATRPHWSAFQDEEAWVVQFDAALAAWQEYWEND